MDRGRTMPNSASHLNLSPRLCPSASSAFLYLLNKWAPPTATRTALPSTIGDRHWKCGYGWNWYSSREYFLVLLFSVNYKVATARQLRICKGGTTGRMKLCQRSFSNMPCSRKMCTSMYSSKGSQRDALQRTISINSLAWLTYSSDLCLSVCLFVSHLLGI